MSQPGDYGGDEIAALVLDPGYSVTRAGFAGEDTPKSVVPTFYGVSESNSAPRFGDNAINNPYLCLDIRNPIGPDGIVEDWETAAKLWEYSISSRLVGSAKVRSIRSSGNGTNGANGEANGEDAKMEDVEEMEKPLSENPLLMTEPGWNPTKHRERTMEIAMESWDCPAFFLARSGVLQAFASGKGSALVVDIGASNSSVTPVIDGMILKKGTIHAPFAGNFVSQQLRTIFAESKSPETIIPHYLVAAKTQVDAGAPAQAKMREYSNYPPQSFRRFQEERVLAEFKECFCAVWDPRKPTGTNLASSVDFIKTKAAAEENKPFEFPDGWNNVYSVERYRAVEGLYDHTAAVSDGTYDTPTASQTIPGMVTAAINGIDADVRANVLDKMIISGGSSLISGTPDRVVFELQNIFPQAKIRVSASTNSVERKFAGWIGGSILASLGSFHQMWVSKKEYDENGPSIVEKRCK